MEKEVGIVADGDGEAAVVDFENPSVHEMSGIFNDSDFTGSDSDSEQEKEYVQSKMERYFRALFLFNDAIAEFESRIPLVTKLSLTSRASFVNNGYESLLMGLHQRPKNIPFDVVQGIDELAAFCSAIMVGWRLWPDWWTGLHMMIDYMADDTLIEDIKRIEPMFLLTLKEIAKNEEWTNLMGAKLLPAKAKKILFRYKKATSTKEGEVDNLHKSLATLLLEQLDMKLAAQQGDQKICDGVDCIEIEATPGEFPHCGKCKKAVYHSKECQVKAWKAGHKKVCKKLQE